MPDTKKKVKTTRKATVLFEDDRFPDKKFTWELGSKLLRLCSTGGPGEGAFVLDTVTIRGKEITIEMAQAEAGKYYDAIDVFEPETIDTEDEEWTDFN